MWRQGQKVPLLLRAENKFVNGWAFKGLTARNLRELKCMRAEALARPPFERDEDAHWDWSTKVQQWTQPEQEVWVIERRRWLDWFSPIPHTQGVAIFGPAQSPLPGGASLVEVDFLSTALHNRARNEHGRVVEGLYRGVGTTLLQLAAEKSRGLGQNGLVGLYALSRAHDFYRKAGLTRHPGITKESGMLVYFEGLL